MNKSTRRIRTRDLRLKSLILSPLSYDDIQQNRSTQTINKIFESPSCDVMS